MSSYKDHFWIPAAIKARAKQDTRLLTHTDMLLIGVCFVCFLLFVYILECLI